MRKALRRVADAHRDRAIAFSGAEAPDVPEPIDPSTEGAHGHELTIGSTGTGKTVSEAIRIIAMLTQSTGCVHGIDPKHDLADLVRVMFAQWWEAHAGEGWSVGDIREMVIARDRVSPWPIFAETGTTPSAQASLTAHLLLAQGDPLSSAGEFILETLIEFAIRYHAPYSPKFFRALLRNRRFRLQALARLGADHLAERFDMIEQDLAGQSGDAVIRRIAIVFADKSVRAALGVPPLVAAAFGFTAQPRLMLTDIAPSRWLSLPVARALARLAVTKAVFDAFARTPEPRLRLVVDELGAVVADVPALLDVVCQSLRLLRSAGVDVVGMLQSAGSMPKSLAVEFENNASRITVFRADAAAADLLFPHLASATDRRATSVRQAAFRADVASLAPRHGYRWVKGTPVQPFETPFVSIPTGDERARLLDVFRHTIAPGSTITIAEAEHQLRLWEQEHLPNDRRSTRSSIFDDEDDA